MGEVIAIDKAAPGGDQTVMTLRQDDMVTHITDPMVINYIMELCSRVAELEYQAMPTSEKPKCQAEVYQGKGLSLPCGRSAMYQSKYCHSHRNWHA